MNCGTPKNAEDEIGEFLGVDSGSAPGIYNELFRSRNGGSYGEMVRERESFSIPNPLEDFHLTPFIE
jgi:hypothetical protein